MKRFLTTLLLSLSLAGPALAQQPDLGPPVPSPAVQGVDGDWEGAIETPEGALTGVFHIVTRGDKTTTLMDSPMQGVTGIPAIASRTGREIVIQVPIVQGSFTGELSADGARISGTWRQGPMELPMTVQRK